MKVRLTENRIGEVFVSKNKRLKVGDEIEVTKTRGEELIHRGVFEEVKETKQKTKDKE